MHNCSSELSVHCVYFPRALTACCRSFSAASSASFALLKLRESDASGGRRKAQVTLQKR